MEAVRTENYKGLVINIYYDEDGKNPRDWLGNENITVFVCEHPRYLLGDKHDVEQEVNDLYCEFVKDDDSLYDLSVNEKLEAIEQTGNIVLLPISIYEHSGIDIWLGSTRGHWDAQWDCSTVGFAYVRKDVAQQKGSFGPDKKFKTWQEWAYNAMESDMETYGYYVRGEIYGFRVDDMEDDPMDSCWGYYGSHGIEQAIEDAKDSIDDYIEARERERKNNLLSLSKNIDKHIGLMVVDGLIVYRIGKDMFGHGIMESAILKDGIVGTFTSTPSSNISDNALKSMVKSMA